MENKIKVSIYGATGYTGIELYRRLKVRDDVEIIDLPSKSSPGKRYSDVVGSLTGVGEEILCEWNAADTVGRSDVVFTALPHGETFEIAKEAKRQNKKLIDIGADYIARAEALIAENPTLTTVYPNPPRTFKDDGTEYTVDDAAWNDFTQTYYDTYIDYVQGVSDDD